MNILIEEYECLDSTNETLYKRGLEGADEGLVILADSQNKGRGRAGRSFYSPSGNLYMSILLRPKKNASDLNLITPMAAVSVYLTVLEEFGISLGIKWVNDLYHKGKKVCGILTSLHLDENNLVDYAVVGIGLNVYSNDIPEELKDIVGFLLDVSEKKVENKKDMKHLALKISECFKNFYESNDHSAMMEIYKNNSILFEKRISYLYGEKSKTADVLDITDEGELVVRFEDGTTECIKDGEIHILEMSDKR